MLATVQSVATRLPPSTVFGSAGLLQTETTPAEMAIAEGARKLLRAAADAWQRDERATSVEARVAGVLDDAGFQQAYTAIRRLLNLDAGDAVAMDTPADDEEPSRTAPPGRKRIQLPAVVMRDEGTRALVERADEAWANVTALMASGELASAPDPGMYAWTSKEDRRTELLWFVYDPLLPSVWVDGQMAMLRSETALILLDALREHAAPDADLQRRLARMWAREYLVFAEYLANAAGLPIGRVTGVDGPSAVQFAADQARHEARLDELYDAACAAAQRDPRE